MSDKSYEGRHVWLEMDKDHSAFMVPARKGEILRVFEESTAREVIIRLIPPARGFFPLPQRLTHVVLRYPSNSDESIGRTFEKGHSYARIFKLKSPDTPEQVSIQDKQCLV